MAGKWAVLGAEDRRREEVAELTRRVAEVCQRAVENVHVVYLAEGVGRVAFGGKMVEG